MTTREVILTEEGTVSSALIHTGGEMYACRANTLAAMIMAGGGRPIGTIQEPITSSRPGISHLVVSQPHLEATPHIAIALMLSHPPASTRNCLHKWQKSCGRAWHLLGAVPHHLARQGVT